MKDGHYITVNYHCLGEQMDFAQSITEEQLNKICEVMNIDDVLHNLTPEHSITISLDNPAKHRQACIDGLIYGDGVSRKIAENIVDGVEMTDEEYDQLNDEEE